MDDPPFAPTECACDACVDCCRRPAHLLPRDVPRLLNRLVSLNKAETLLDALKFFRPGAGAVIGDRSTGRTKHIATIVPDVSNRTGWCRLFDEATRRCTVHDVAPFGCRYFDTHMNREEGNARSLWGLSIIDAAIVAGNRAYPLLLWLLSDQPTAQPRPEWFGSPVRRWEQAGVLWWCGCACARLDDGRFETKFMCAQHEVAR